MEGVGVFSMDDGRKYDGQFKNDLKHGTGTFTWADGRMYNGQWD